MDTISGGFRRTTLFCGDDGDDVNLRAALATTACTAGGEDSCLAERRLWIPVMAPAPVRRGRTPFTVVRKAVGYRTPLWWAPGGGQVFKAVVQGGAAEADPRTGLRADKT